MLFFFFFTINFNLFFFFFSSRRRHTRSLRDWSSDVCSSDLAEAAPRRRRRAPRPLQGLGVQGAALSRAPRGRPDRPVDASAAPRRGGVRRPPRRARDRAARERRLRPHAECRERAAPGGAEASAHG